MATIFPSVFKTTQPATPFTWDTKNDYTFLGRGEIFAYAQDSNRIYAFGGMDLNDLKSAETYNFSTHTWSKIASMGTPRQAHTATMLNSGQVFICGGATRQYGKLAVSFHDSAEVYDTVNDIYTPVPVSMVTERSNHTATILPSGDVLIIGGFNSLGVLNKVESYTGAAFVAKTDLNTERYAHTATLTLGGDKVIVTGGINSLYNTIDSIEIYDILSNTWTVSTQVLNNKVANHRAALLADGRILICGGNNGLGPMSFYQIYDPNTDTISVAKNMQSVREFHSIIKITSGINNGRILVYGGLKSSSTYVHFSEIYDPDSDNWIPTLSHYCDTRNSGIGTTDGKTIIVFGGNEKGLLSSGITSKCDTNKLGFLSWEFDTRMTTRPIVAVSSSDTSDLSSLVGGEKLNFNIGGTQVGVTLTLPSGPGSINRNTILEDIDEQAFLNSPPITNLYAVPVGGSSILLLCASTVTTGPAFMDYSLWEKIPFPQSFRIDPTVTNTTTLTPSYFGPHIQFTQQDVSNELSFPDNSNLLVINCRIRDRQQEGKSTSSVAIIVMFDVNGVFEQLVGENKSVPTTLPVVDYANSPTNGVSVSQPTIFIMASSGDEPTVNGGVRNYSLNITPPPGSTKIKIMPVSVNMYAKAPNFKIPLVVPEFSAELVAGCR